MKISIIIPSYNQVMYIEETILCILNQNYSNKEIIVVDGGSTDGTLEILKKYNDEIKWISEKDDGQADALNKGLKIATGEIIGWLNSDDLYFPNILSDVIETFKNKKCEWVIGKIAIKNEINNTLVYYKKGEVTYNYLFKKTSIRQQAAFYKRKFLVEHKGWSKEFFMVMDFDLWIRLAKSSNPIIVDSFWGIFRVYGDQKTSGENLLKQIGELNFICKREGKNIIQRIIILRKKYIYLFKYYLKYILILFRFLPQKYKNISYRNV